MVSAESLELVDGTSLLIQALYLSKVLYTLPGTVNHTLLFRISYSCAPSTNLQASSCMITTPLHPTSFCWSFTYSDTGIPVWQQIIICWESIVTCTIIVYRVFLHVRDTSQRSTRYQCKWTCIMYSYIHPCNPCMLHWNNIIISLSHWELVV